MALEFVSRQEWGARAPRQVTKRDPSTLAGVALHWFGSPSAAASHEGCPALLRSVQNAHMAPGGLGASGGANDIAYNHAVCPHGVAFTLRGFGVQTGANALVRFDPASGRFTVVRLPSSPANVRQILGRRGEVWGAESGVDKLVLVRTR